VSASRTAVTAPKVVRVLGFEEGDRSVARPDIQERKQACAMLEIEMALQRGSLCDLVPEVLDVAVPTGRSRFVPQCGFVLSITRDFSLH